MSKVVALLALVSMLVLGATATSIVARDSVPAATAEFTSSVSEPTANRSGKADRLDVASVPAQPVSVASAEPAEPLVDGQSNLRQAYAAASAADISGSIATSPETTVSGSAPSPARPKPAIRPQKPYSLLSDGQIAGIKDRLHLSSSQESYWPAVETALRNVARRIQANCLSNPNAGGMPIDPDSQEIQELKSAAMPLLFQLRDDQKEEVRKLARLIGLEKVARQI